MSGNWSKPLTIPLDDECGKPILKNISGITTIFPSVTTNIVPSTEITTIVPSVTTNIVSSTETDPLLFVWIAVGVMLVTITTCIVLFVVIAFHWKQKRRRISQANCTNQTKEVGNVGGIPS